jgi:arginyl-tRNA synthetase
LRASRLALSALTQDVLSTGLGLLGVPMPERM